MLLLLPAPVAKHISPNRGPGRRRRRSLRFGARPVRQDKGADARAVTLPSPSTSPLRRSLREGSGGDFSPSSRD